MTAAKKQKTFEGMERKQNAKVSAKGRALRTVDRKWKELGRERKKKIEDLVATMRAEKVPIYIDDEAAPPLRIDLTEKFEVKITDWKEPPEEKPEPVKPPPEPVKH